jgi:hypothetical protein
MELEPPQPEQRLRQREYFEQYPSDSSSVLSVEQPGAAVDAAAHRMIVVQEPASAGLVAVDAAAEKVSVEMMTAVSMVEEPASMLASASYLSRSEHRIWHDPRSDRHNKGSA